MAEITRTNGNVKGQGSGGTTGAISADELVILNGADLDFFNVLCFSKSNCKNFHG